MTGGAIGSLLAQHFHRTAAERMALLVAAATPGMTVAVACAVAGFIHPLAMEPGPLFPLQTAVPGPLAMVSCVIAGLACGMLAAALSTSLYKVEDLFGELPLPGESCRTVATRMARHGLERLPVVRDASSMALVGLVARSDLIKPSLVHFDDEEKRERMRGLPWQP